MHVYEVIVRFDRSDDAARFPAFMTEEHVPAILASGVFVAATFERDTADPQRFRTLYHAVEPSDVERYLSQLAERFRSDFRSRFPDGVRIERAVWEIVAKL